MSLSSQCHSNSHRSSRIRGQSKNAWPAFQPKVNQEGHPDATCIIIVHSAHRTISICGGQVWVSRSAVQQGTTESHMLVTAGIADHTALN